MEITRLKNIPTYDPVTKVTRGNRCNIITFYCDLCDEFHTKKRNEVVYFDLEDGQMLCCYESAKIILNVKTK